MTITVFTATHNRADLLPRAYEALRRQTVKDFEWLIVDDRSADHTEQLVAGWQRECKEFPIRYYKRTEEPGGLQRAINYGYILAQGRWMLKCDSDDYLLDDGVESILQWLKTVEKDPKCLGVGGFYQRPDGTRHVAKQPPFSQVKPYIDATFFERPQNGLGVDTLEAYRVDIRKNYPIPVWETERSGPERVAFANMAQDGYYIRWFNKDIAVVDYQPDGLTSTGDKNKRQIPMAEAIAFNYFASYSFYSLKRRIYYSSEYVYYAMLGKNMKYIMKAKAPFVLIAGFPMGLLKYIKRELHRRK